MLAAISLFVPCLMGLGLLALLALPGFWSSAGADLPARATGLAAALALGIAVYYVLALAVGRPATAVPIALLLAAAGWLGAMVLARRDFRAALALGLRPYLLLLALVGVASLHVLLRPLEADDARFMWFNHARIVYYFGDLHVLADWGWDRDKIAQAYYPKLLALLAGTAAHLAGFWNEYLPKAALLALLLPPTVAALAFWRERLAFLFVLLAFFAVPHEFMWDGMMDGYLALYVGFGAIHLGRWLESRSLPDLTGGIAFLGVATGLKIEANLVLVALAATALFLWLRPDGALRAAVRAAPPAVAIPALVAFSGFILWHVLQRLWHLEPDLTFGPEGWERLLQRLRNPWDLRLIGERYLFGWRTLTGFAFAGATLWLLRRWRATMPPGVALALGTALLYFAGILLVYLMTPHGLFYHLASSADRVLMTPRALVFAAVALWLQERERSARAPRAA